MPKDPPKTPPDPGVEPDADDADLAEESRSRKRQSQHKREEARRSLWVEPALSPEELPPRPKSSRVLPLEVVVGGRVPMEFWATGWLLKAIDDHLWRIITRDSANPFPATLREECRTHPGYVLCEIGNYGVRLCPVTTRRHSTPYIPVGVRLEPGGFLWGKDSYPVFRAASTLPRNNGIFPQLPKFIGVYPPKRLVR